MILELEKLLACPNCHGDLAFEGRLANGSDKVGGNLAIPRCTRCRWTGRVTAEILDFVDDRILSERHQDELRAQRNAVQDYYENEDKISCHWDRISADELPELLGHPTGPIADIGCGTGNAAAALRRAGGAVVGVDLTIACLEVARRRADAVVRADAARLPFQDGAFDAVVARGALHHLADTQAAMREIRRVLRPGGRALLVDPREFVWLEPVKHAIRKHDESFTDDHHAYSVDEYAALVAQHLSVEQVLTFHPLGIMVAVGLDLFPLPSWLPKRAMARTLYSVDRLLDRTPLHRGGHLVAVRAVRT